MHQQTYSPTKIQSPPATKGEAFINFKAFCGDSGHATSTTTSGISGIAGDQTKRTGDAEQGIANNFDKEAVEKEIAAQVAITKSFTEQAPKVVGDFAAGKTKPIDEAKEYQALEAKEKAGTLSDSEKQALNALRAQDMTADKAAANLQNPELLKDYDNWREGGPLRVLLHGAIGAFAGGLGGALGAVTTQTLIPRFGDYLLEQGIDGAGRALLLQAMSLAIGGTAGGAQGAMTGYGATTNNYLAPHQWAALGEELAKCKGNEDCETAVRKKYARISAVQDAQMRRDCQDFSSAACREHIKSVYQGSLTQEKLAKEGKIPPEYLGGGSDLQANGRLIVKNTINRAIGVMYSCDKQPQKCAETSAQMAQLAVELTGVGGTIESVLQLITGKETLTGAETNRWLSALGLIPFAGILKKVGEPVVETIIKLTGKDLKVAKEAAEGAGEKLNESLLWGGFSDYPKVTIDGKQYAQIGDRVYTEHAVNRMQPSGLGAPAGETSPGRNVTPNMVDYVINNGQATTAVVNGVPRTIFTSGNVSVVTENGGRLIVTILRNRSQ